MHRQQDERRPMEPNGTRRLTESQSVYIRESHRDDIQAGDASADVDAARLRSNLQRRHGDRKAATVSRAGQRTAPSNDPDGER